MISGLRSRDGRSLSWSAAYLLVTRISTVIAVPIVLGTLGEHLYAAWVLAGTLVMSQGLIDIGMGAATVRFVSVATAVGDRRAVRSVASRSLVFYAGLSGIAGLAILVFAGPLIDAMPALHGTSRSDVVGLLSYTVVAFGVSNIVLVLASVLQGMGRVDVSYRGQTLGWLLYCPILAVLVSEGGGVDALGLAWVISYGAQALLLAPPIWSAARKLDGPAGAVPSTRELLSLGGRWSVSLWADFAALQLPRIIGGVSLDANALVQLDLAMRGAQLVVAPFFAAFPLILPAAARAWASNGRDGLRALLVRWTPPLIAGLVILTAAALPILRPLLALWSGRTVGSIAIALPGLVLIGISAHTVTGAATSVLLAAGDLKLVTQYKMTQLVASLALMGAAAPFGATALGAMFSASMTLPAVVFMVRTHREFAARALGVGAARRLIAACIAVAAPAFIVAVLLPPTLAASEQVAAIAACLAAALGALSLTPKARRCVTEARQYIHTAERAA